MIPDPEVSMDISSPPLVPVIFLPPPPTAHAIPPDAPVQENEDHDEVVLSTETKKGVAPKTKNEPAKLQLYWQNGIAK